MPVIGSEYELARRERNAAREPIQVVMGGETFTLLPTIPISSAFDLRDAPEPKPGDTMEADAIRALAGFIRLALVDEDQPRWDALLARRVDAVDGADVLAWGTMIAGVYSPVPSGPPSDSSGGRRKIGDPLRKPGRKATSRT